MTPRSRSSSSRGGSSRPSRSLGGTSIGSGSAGWPLPRRTGAARSSTSPSIPWRRPGSRSRTTTGTLGSRSSAPAGAWHRARPGSRGSSGPPIAWNSAGPRRTRRGRTTPRGTAEGLILWDAEPAGDHVRVRMTYRNPEGTPSVRLAVEPGVILRDAAIPGVVDLRREGTAERPEWVASVDPPLPDGTTIGLEFWRPVTAPSSREPKAVPAPPAGARALRRIPRIEPLGVDRYAGSLGFRRPADWSGRLAAGFGVAPISDEAFVKLWGNLPDEPLTLSGTTRFVRAPEIALPTGPLPGLLSVRPAVQLVIGPGRIEVVLEADLVDLDVASREVNLSVPPRLQPVRVEADGMTDWSRPAPDRVRLRFDGPQSLRRQVRIRGWIPVPSDPLATSALRGETQVPWPRWLGVDLQPGDPGGLVADRVSARPRAGIDHHLLGATGGRVLLRRAVPDDLPGRSARGPRSPHLGFPPSAGRRDGPEPLDDPPRLGGMGRGPHLSCLGRGLRCDPSRSSRPPGRHGRG